MGTSIDSQVMSTIDFSFPFLSFPFLFFCTPCAYTCLDCETLGVYCCLLLFTAVSKFYWSSIEEYLHLIDPLSIILNAFIVCWLIPFLEHIHLTVNHFLLSFTIYHLIIYHTQHTACPPPLPSPSLLACTGSRSCEPNRMGRTLYGPTKIRPSSPCDFIPFWCWKRTFNL